MGSVRSLIVNADDFGQSPGVNRGVIRAHERGIVTSASLMVRWPAAAEAAAYARAHPRLGVGLHLDLGEWTCRDGHWAQLYEVVRADDPDAVAAEVTRQLDAFRRLLGRDPTHLDSHQHAHRDEPLHSLLLEEASRLGVPLRWYCPAVRYCGDFYGQTGKGEPVPGAVSVPALVAILRGLPEGFTELACHPGLDGDVEAMYCRERALEVKVLCAPAVRRAVLAEGIELCTFADAPRRPARPRRRGRRP